MPLCVAQKNRTYPIEFDQKFRLFRKLQAEIWRNSVDRLADCGRRTAPSSRARLMRSSPHAFIARGPRRCAGHARVMGARRLATGHTQEVGHR